MMTTACTEWSVLRVCTAHCQKKIPRRSVNITQASRRPSAGLSSRPFNAGTWCHRRRKIMLACGWYLAGVIIGKCRYCLAESLFKIWQSSHHHVTPSAQAFMVAWWSSPLFSLLTTDSINVATDSPTLLIIYSLCLCARKRQKIYLAAKQMAGNSIYGHQF